MAAWSGPYLALLSLSVLLPLGAVAATLQVKRLRPALVGLCFAMGGLLVFEALVPTARLALIPELLVGPWLLLQAALCVGLGGLVLKPER